METFGADDVDVSCQAPGCEESDRGTSERVLGRVSAGLSWVEHLATILVDTMGFLQCAAAPQFYWDAIAGIAFEFRMDE